MKWIVEHEVVWLFDGRRVHGRIAIGVPELVPDGDGDEADDDPESATESLLAMFKPFE